MPSTLSNVQKMQVLNRYYRITRFYSFLKNVSIKTGLFIGILAVIFLVLDHFLLDVEALIHSMAHNYSGWLLFPLLFLSEAVFGLLPPELFIAWSSSTSNPWLNLTALATMSYAGGVLAYFIGKWMYRIPFIANYVEVKMKKNIMNLKKWGGVFVFVGALLPVPHSLVSLASGIIGYKITHYMGWALFRYIRFGLYALVIYSL